MPAYLIGKVCVFGWISLLVLQSYKELIGVVEPGGLCGPSVEYGRLTTVCPDLTPIWTLRGDMAVSGIDNPERAVSTAVRGHC
jgi:hypothetical protein